MSNVWNAHKNLALQMQFSTPTCRYHGRDSSFCTLIKPNVGYGLVPAHDFFEPLISFVGRNPCQIQNADIASPQQHALSCLASANNIALSTNVFVALSNNTHRIMSIVFNESGAVVATYSKHHVVPIAEVLGLRQGHTLPPHFRFLGANGV